MTKRTTLPDYAVERFHIDEERGSYDMLQVTCPRKDCGGEFWVTGAWAAEKLVHEGDKRAVIVGRSCPYCSKSAEVPARKSQVVRRRRK